jgi:hypothetical protein
MADEHRQLRVARSIRKTLLCRHHILDMERCLMKLFEKDSDVFIRFGSMSRFDPFGSMNPSIELYGVPESTGTLI